MTVPTLDKAVDSIEILHNVKPGNINEASNFLTDLQQSNYAWSIADQLLYMNRDLITSYFGAQTMRNKIQLHFEELPVESHMALKESLMKHVNNINVETNSTVSTQLSLALADLFCHMVQWPNALDEIINTYSQNVNSIPVLLDVLRYIPEEFSNRSLRLGVNRKTQIFSELDRCNTAVVNVMEHSLNLSNDTIFVKCIECLNSWFVINLFHDNDLLNSRLIPFVFDILKRPGEANESLFKAAAQCATDFFCNDCQTIPQLTHQFQTYTYDLGSAYRLCEVSKPEYCLNYAKVFCEMASALLPVVLENPQFDSNASPGDYRTLQMLLLTARTNRECCALVLDVLIDVTENRNSNAPDESITRLAPVFEDLISIMTRHCAVSEVSEDDDQSLSGFRADVFLVMEQIRMFVDIEVVFRKMLGELSQLLMNSNVNSSRSNEAEAVLCIIGSLVKFVDTDSDENASWTEQLLTQVILPCIPRAQPSFRDVAFTMFGELCRWASKNESIMDLMIYEMASFVLETNFDASDDLQMSAFNSALQALATFCKRQPAHLLQSSRWSLIIRMCQRFTELRFISKELVGFYEALGKCLCVPSTAQGVKEIGQSAEELSQKLWQLCQINVEIVNQLVQKNKLSCVPKDPCDPCVWIDNISAIFVSMARMASGKGRSDQHDESAVIAKQPYLAAHYMVLQQYIWPVLSSLIDCFIGDGRVLERVVRILRYTLRAFQMLTKPLLGSIAQKIVEAYIRSKESCFLYAGGILVDEFGDDNVCKQGLIQMFHAFSIPALEVLRDNGLHENPNTTEDLFRLMVRLVQRCSPDFLSWESLQVEQLFSMAVRSIFGTNIDAKTLALRFLVEAFNCAKQINDVSFPVRNRTVSWLHTEGLFLLWEALLYLCRWKSDEVMGGDLVEDMTDLVLTVRWLCQLEMFQAALDTSIGRISVARRDGMLYATESQIQQFRSAMIESNQVLDGLETFAKLFL